MTPVEQSDLPWLLTCTDDAMEAARIVLTHLDKGRRTTDLDGRRRFSYAIGDPVNENGASIEIMSRLDEKELVSFTTIMSKDLIPDLECRGDRHMFGFVHDLLEQAIGSPRIPHSEERLDPVTSERVDLAAARMALAAGMTDHTIGLVADNVDATPLGTGGLHLVRSTRNIASDHTDEWCVPGAVELVVTRTLPTATTKGRIVMRMSAEGWLHMIRVPDVMGMMRLEADARKDRR